MRTNRVASVGLLVAVAIRSALAVAQGPVPAGTAAAPAADPDMLLEIVADTPPASPLVVSLGPKVVGIAPLTLRLPASTTPQELALVGQTAQADFAFVFELAVGATGASLSAKPPRHCGPERATALVSGPKNHQVAKITFSRAGNWSCGGGPATAPPDNKAKFAFTADPSDATLFYPDAAVGLGRYALPKSLIVPVFYGPSFSAVIKKDGYFDCVLDIRFTRGSPPTVTINAVTRPLSLDPLGTPNVAACSLKKIEQP